MLYLSLKYFKQYLVYYLYKQVKHYNHIKTVSHTILKCFDLSQEKTLEHLKVYPIKIATYYNRLHYLQQLSYSIIYMHAIVFEAETIRFYIYKLKNIFDTLCKNIIFAIDHFKKSLDDDIF